MKKVLIIGLVRGYGNLHEYELLIQRNIHIKQNILSKVKIHKYDNIIFHEGNISLDQQEYIKTRSGDQDIIFANIREWGPKTAFNDSKNLLNMEICPPMGVFPLGYKHMCHFWSHDIFDYSIDYDYIIRIDEDCVMTKVDINELESIISNDIKFSVAWLSNVLEYPDKEIYGLENFLYRFCERNNFTMLDEFENARQAYTNFMIVNVEYYRNQNLVQKLLREIDECNCVYSNRWSDAVLWGIIVYLFDKNKYNKTKGIEYYHESHKKLIEIEKSN